MGRPRRVLNNKILFELKTKAEELRAAKHPDATKASLEYNNARKVFHAQKRDKRVVRPEDVKLMQDAQEVAEKLYGSTPTKESKRKPGGRVRIPAAGSPAAAEAVRKNGVTDVRYHFPGAAKVRKEFITPVEGPQLPPDLEKQYREVQRAKLEKRIAETGTPQPKDNVGQQLSPYTPAQRSKWREVEAKKQADANAKAKPAQVINPGSGRDTNGFTQQDHEAAFDTAHHHWWSTKGKKVYTNVDGVKKIDGAAKVVRPLSEKYRSSEAFTAPALYMKKVKTREANRIARLQNAAEANGPKEV